MIHCHPMKNKLNHTVCQLLFIYEIHPRTEKTRRTIIHRSISADNPARIRIHRARHKTQTQRDKPKRIRNSPAAAAATSTIPAPRNFL